MTNTAQFAEVLEAVEQLPTDDQELLLDIVQHRLAERARQRLADDVREARQEFDAGQATPATPDQIMERIE